MNNTKFYRILSLIIATLLVFGCNQEKPSEPSGFEVNGKITNGAGIKQVSIQEITPGGLISIDTAELKSDGSFTLNGALTERTFCILRFEKGDVVLLVDTNSKLNVKIDASDIAKYSVDNSKENEELRQLYLINNSWMKKSEEVNRRFSMYNETNLTPEVQEQIRVAFDSVQMGHKNAVKEYIGSLTNSMVPYFATTFLLPEPDMPFLEALDNSLFPKYSQSKYALQLHQKVESLRKTAEGAMAPDIVLNDPFGKTVSLSALRGKVVLIDFWASWCGPCREENPSNVLLYNKYKNAGFEIFGVSLDENRDAWIGAINKDKLLWPHGSDLLKWNSPVVSLYNIDAIPFTVLVDKEGKIIAKKLRGAELAAKLKEIFGF